MEIIDMHIDSTELLELRARNELRLVAAKNALGTSWLLHASNGVKKLVVRPPVLKTKKR